MHFGYVASIIVVFALKATAQNLDTLSYEPNVVTIAGVVVQDTFPGRPNYESIKSGDQPEVYWILNLPKPVSVRGIPNDDTDVTEDNISRIQLVFMGFHGNNKYRKLLNRKVKVTGQLFHAISGHHHTTVLLKVSNMVAG